jgi:nucleoid-associated protein YgaU
MVDPAVKIAAALCILLMGACAAMLFRRDGPHATPEPSAEQLLIPYRATPDLSGGRVAADRRSAPAGFPGQSPLRSAAMLKPLGPQEPPPALAREYPTPPAGHDAQWGKSMDAMLPANGAENEAPRTHKIVDGDTLTALAERYLGSATRAKEIFKANRDILMDPNLLPIGVELKIPPRAGHSKEKPRE